MAETVNSFVATRLDEVALILEEQGANVFRVVAYRRAAAMLRGLRRPIDELIKTEGVEGLQQLPGIGETLARFIHQLVVTGRLPMLERLRGESQLCASGLLHLGAGSDARHNKARRYAATPQGPPSQARHVQVIQFFQLDRSPFRSIGSRSHCSIVRVRSSRFQ